MYMRSSISAQSCASVPPAPALMLTSAPLRSYGPDSMRANSILPTASSAAVSVAPASTAVASSLASSASSIRTPRVLEPPCSCASSRRPSTSAAPARAARPAPCRPSFQKSRRAVCSSSSAMRRRLPSMSKMPPENLQSALQLRQTFSQGADFHGGGSVDGARIAPRPLAVSEARRASSFPSGGRTSRRARGGTPRPRRSASSRPCAGTPSTRLRGGITVRGVTSAPAPTTEPRADDRVVEDRRLHADQAGVLDAAGVEHGAVADDAVGADVARAVVARRERPSRPGCWCARRP